jgi:hypothetical protein
MHVEDAVLLLDDILDYELIVDSILPSYERNDSIHKELIKLDLSKIRQLQITNDAQVSQISNLESIIKNVNEIKTFKDVTIDNAKSLVRKERIKKGLGIMAAGVGGIGVGFTIGYILSR